jgi:ribonuclease P protein component
MKQSRDFARLKREGRSYPGHAMVLSVRPLDPSESDAAAPAEFQFGLITTRRIGNAVVRNRVRRRLREIIRHHRHSLLPGFTWVIIARWRAPALTQADLEKDWLRLARKAGILARPAPAPAP